MNRQKFLIIVLFISLVISDVFFTYTYFSHQREVKILEEKQYINENVLNFTQLFVSKVLSGQKEISFEDRLQLENSIRALKDKEVFDYWDKFTKAKDQTEVQDNFYNLFSLLLKKIEK